MKPSIYDAGKWGIPALYPRISEPTHLTALIPEDTKEALIFLERLIGDLRVEDVAPRFRFLHLHGVHLPSVIDANCRGFPSATNTRTISVDTSRCLLRTLDRYFEAMLEAGIYDDSIIVIAADHGHPWEPVRPDAAEPPLPKPRRDGAGALEDWSGGVPAFLVKAPGARGPLRISDRPVPLCDIPATVLDALEIRDAEGFDCESVFNPDRSAPRWHYRHATYEVQKTRPRKTRFRLKFERFKADGHSWYPSSWLAE